METENQTPAGAPPEPREKPSGRVVMELGTLPEKALLDETALAKAIGCCTRTIRRMVNSYELPPPARFAGRSVWQVGAVNRWIEARLDRAMREAERAEKLLAQTDKGI
jgi:predicted DNA-binding transcriptional regulator AlpA